jgi:hypothetical protein
LSDNREDRWLDLDLAAANVNRAGTLVGSTIAVFTFLLFFLYPRFSSGQIDPVLFQVTLTIIVLTILSFSLSGLFYYRIGVLKLNTAKKSMSMQRGALFWLFGTLFVLLEPALILFTVGLAVVGSIALIAWIVYALVTLRDATAYGNLYGST